MIEECRQVMIDLLTTGMLRMRPEERFSAGVCLTKGYDLRLFNGHSLDLGNATPTRQTDLQGELSDDDGSTTILLGALWESSNHDDNSRTGRCTPEHTSGVLESRNLRVSSSPSNGDDQGSQIGKLCNCLSSIISGFFVSSRGWIDTSRRIQMTAISGRRLGKEFFRQGPDQTSISRSSSHTGSYLARCRDLGPLLKARWSIGSILYYIRYCPCSLGGSSLIRELSEFLTRLEITGMKLTRNDLSGHDIVATNLNNQKIMLASLTPFKPMSSIADLASHLLHLMQLQSPQSASTSTVPVNDPSLRACIITDDKRLRSWTVNSIDSYASIPTARQYGLTYPSALLDCTNLSGCSTPT